MSCMTGGWCVFLSLKVLQTDMTSTIDIVLVTLDITCTEYAAQVVA